jgi:hypothetical protein
MSAPIEEGRYKARITSGLIQNIETFPDWDLELSFRLAGRVNPDDPASLLPCPEVERAIATRVREGKLDPVLQALGCHADFRRRVEPGEVTSYSLEGGEVLVDCRHVRQDGHPEERWELGTMPFNMLKIELTTGAAVRRLPEQLPNWNGPDPATRRS